MAAKLERSGIKVVDVFYPKDEAELGHEYQFIMNTPQARQTYGKLIQFLIDTNREQHSVPKETRLQSLNQQAEAAGKQ